MRNNYKKFNIPRHQKFLRKTLSFQRTDLIKFRAGCVVTKRGIYDFFENQEFKASLSTLRLSSRRHRKSRNCLIAIRATALRIHFVQTLAWQSASRLTEIDPWVNLCKAKTQTLALVCYRTSITSAIQTHWPPLLKRLLSVFQWPPLNNVR